MTTAPATDRYVHFTQVNYHARTHVADPERHAMVGNRVVSRCGLDVRAEQIAGTGVAPTCGHCRRVWERQHGERAGGA